MAARRNRLPLIGLLCADAISDVGNLLTMIALPWFVLETTGSATKTALTVSAVAIPVVITGLLGGALVDRVGYRKMSIASDLAGAAATAAIPLLHTTIGLEFWQLLGLVLLGALLDSPGSSARSALYPELAEAGRVSLERANGSLQMVRRISGLIGPPLAGVLILVLGPSQVLWLDAATFLISASIVLAAVPSRLEPPAAAGDSTGYVGQVVEGARFLKKEQTVLWLVIVTAAGNLLAEPVYLVVLPLLANQVYDSSVALGMMFAALAAGSLVGNGLYLTIGPGLPRRRVVIVGYLVRALTFCILPFSPPLWAMCASIFLNAVCLEPVNPILLTVFQERVPAGMRGRVFGILRASAAGVRPIGLMTYGAVAGSLGLQTALIVVAVVNFGVPIVSWIAPGLRQLDSQNHGSHPNLDKRINASASFDGP